MKTEVDSSLSDYSTITYLQDKYMTSLLITQALMNNYASITFIITCIQKLHLIQH